MHLDRLPISRWQEAAHAEHRNILGPHAWPGQHQQHRLCQVLGQSSPPSQVKDIIFHARATGKSTRGTASKLYGIANFLEQGIYGRVGYGGPMAIKARQDETIAAMTPRLKHASRWSKQLCALNWNEISVFPLQQHRFLAASGAAVEADNPGSGGFHFIFFQPGGSQIRLSFVATNCDELPTLWQPAETHIAQLELSMVLDRTAWPVSQSSRPLFLDNVAAVMTLVRGRSNNPDLAKLGHLIHPALHAQYI